MKLFFDQNISFRITKKLIGLFPECKHVSDCSLMDCEDQTIWDFARQNKDAIQKFLHEKDYREMSCLEIE